MTGRPSSPFVRGFKARTQRMALTQREALGLAAIDPLDPRRLADHLDVTVLTPRDLPSFSPEDLAELTGPGADCWSALTIPTASGVMVLHNPEHEDPRTNNSISHELSHLLLDHRHGAMHQVGDCIMRDFDEVQEKEADWLAGSLLLPEAALRRVRSLGWDHDTAAQHYGVSTQLFRWRWNAGGFGRTYSRSA